ncbi:helix-turn-helix domain-containing protein [Paracoccus sp. TK19116]|uniref:Helix-turn-helix domain-containing protein n=1 Tax=Paracoccus albicereus TaxID=2922394 RepID=A0ABT1MPD8_9RHOB|nr:helix-turn-helix domain-containing protein [Paracoccus albicereus]
MFALRRQAGESLQQVADGVGVSKAHIWELEKGRSNNPSFDLVRKIAAHFGVTTDALAGEQGLPGPEEQRIGRLHRDLRDLEDEDLKLVEDMIVSLQARTARLRANG